MSQPTASTVTPPSSTHSNLSTDATARTTAHGLVVSHPSILGGTPVFRGTGLPAATLFDYLADGLSIEFFIENYPSITRDQARAVVAYGWDRIESELESA